MASVSTKQSKKFQLVEQIKAAADLMVGGCTVSVLLGGAACLFI